jgi:hypothetical protein
MSSTEGCGKNMFPNLNLVSKDSWNRWSPLCISAAEVERERFKKKENKKMKQETIYIFGDHFMVDLLFPTFHNSPLANTFWSSGVCSRPHSNHGKKIGGSSGCEVVFPG